MDIQQVDRMRHLWKDARAKYTSFFACLSEVRREIGDEALEEWCRTKLMIGLIAINKAAGLLRDVDADRTRSELSDVARTAKEKRELEAHARRMEAQERKNALSAKKVENAERKAKEAEEAKKAKKAAAAAERKARRADKGDAIIRACGEILRNETATREEVMRIADVPRNVYDKARAKLAAEGRLKSVGVDAGADQKALYDQLVIEAREFAGHQWKIGDLASRATATKIYGDRTLEHFAEDVYAEFETIKTYRAVAQAWPEKGGRPPFSIAGALRAHPDRHAVVADNPYITVEEAREIMRKYKAETNVVNLRG